MEFPNLGEHCDESTCNKLDFLPIKCDSCKKNFCTAHYAYQNHNCPIGITKDRQVPQCPLCQAAITVSTEQSIDFIVSRHIDSDCKSDVACKRRIYTNKCNMKACKKKELVPVTCDKCKKNFCFRHRWETDHDCQGPPAKGSFISNTAAAAISRFSQQSSSIGSRNHYSLPPVNSRNKQPTTSAYQRPSSNHVKNIQGNMTEDEALARALQASIQPSVQHSDTRPMNDQEKEDRELSLALQMSEQQQNRQANPEQKEKSCSTM